MTFPTLPASAIDLIFSTMVTTYGSDWFMKWEGIAEDVLRGKWATDLGGYVNRLDAIVYALEHLPVDRPPNSLQFRVICMAAPSPDPEPVPQLPGMPPKKADISRLHAAMARYEELRAERAKRPRQWAYDLQEREKRGEPLSDWQRQAWREAVRTNPAITLSGDFNTIENHVLPPAMQRKQQP